MRQKLFYSTQRETITKKTKLVENCDDNGTEQTTHWEDASPLDCCE